MIRRVISLVLAFGLIFQQAGFAQMAVDISKYFAASNIAPVDRLRPVHMRYFSLDSASGAFNLILDKGDSRNLTKPELDLQGKEVFNYFLIGLSLPNESFWVNLRPDSPENMIDTYLAQTEVGKIFLEADLQLKKDTALLTSPQNPAGRQYWDRLYEKAGELFGGENITIPTLTRPWIVPGEVIVRHSQDSAYLYKATLKVMLEQDYLKNSVTYNFSDPRLKQLNEYSSELIRQLILPQLNKLVNNASRYAKLRQVYYSLILAQWFKTNYSSDASTKYAKLIDSRNLTGLTSLDNWSSTEYFKQYQKSFQQGEYNIQEPRSGLTGATIRTYFSGGINIVSSPAIAITANGAGFVPAILKNPKFMKFQPEIVSSPVKRNWPGDPKGSFRDSQGRLHTGTKGFVDANGRTHIGQDGFVDADGRTHIGTKGHVDSQGRTVYGRYKESSSPVTAEQIKENAEKKLGEFAEKGDWELAKEIYKIISDKRLNLIDKLTKIISPEKARHSVMRKQLTKVIDAMEITDDSFQYGEIALYIAESNRLIRLIDDMTKELEEISYNNSLSLGYRLAAKMALLFGKKEKEKEARNKIAQEIVDLSKEIKEEDEESLLLLYTAQILLFPEVAQAFAASSSPDKLKQSSPEKNSSPVNSLQSERPGGIDFRYINMVTQAQLVPSKDLLKLPDINTLKAINPDIEAANLKQMMSAGIMPASERIMEFVSACYLKESPQTAMEKTVPCLVEFFRLEEQELAETPAQLKAFLAFVDSSQIAM